MKKSIILFFLLSFTCLNSQIQNYCEYQKQINKAELLLTENKRSEALRVYYNTLSIKKGNFCKDIYNALIIADELNSKDTFFYLLNFLKPKGLKNTYLSDLDLFKKYALDKRWMTFLNENSKYVCPNLNLKAQIDSLRFKDQEFRRMTGSYKVYGDTIKKIDSINMQFIYSLVEQNKFPGEDEIGLNNISGSQNYDIVFHHYTQSTSLDSNKRKPKLTSIIVNLVQQGKLIPNRASEWLDMQQSDYNGGVFDVLNFVVKGKETGFYIPKQTYDKKVIIAECRKWLCLEPLEDYYKKFVWKLNNPKSMFNFSISRNSFDLGDDEESFKKITKNMELIK